MWEPQPPWDLLGPPASWQFQVFLIVFRRGSWSQGSFEGLGLQLMGVLLKVKWGEILCFIESILNQYYKYIIINTIHGIDQHHLYHRLMGDEDPKNSEDPFTF